MSIDGSAVRCSAQGNFITFVTVVDLCILYPFVSSNNKN
jgi:hypothetical protein